jgi:hypothetical protein
MKLPPLKIILINIIYWTCVAIVTVISTAIGTSYSLSDYSYELKLLFFKNQFFFQKSVFFKKSGVQIPLE